MFLDIYNTLLYQPILNLLVFFYNISPFNDIGTAIILLTIVIKLILSPFFVQSIKAQKKMQLIQPKMDELKDKYKNEKEKLGPAIMELYKKENVNPFSSCIPILIQFPFLIAVYQVFSHGFGNGSLDLVYPFISNPGSIDPIAFGFIDFSKNSIVLALLAGGAQFIQSKLMFAKNKNTPASSSAQNSMATAMNKNMLYFMPVITVFIGSSLPGGLTFYWFLVTILSALHQWFIFKKMEAKTDI